LTLPLLLLLGSIHAFIGGRVRHRGAFAPWDSYHRTARSQHVGAEPVALGAEDKDCRL
jgi:hypothetical protein